MTLEPHEEPYRLYFETEQRAYKKWQVSSLLDADWNEYQLTLWMLRFLGLEP
jgi:hypothetical protein